MQNGVLKSLSFMFEYIGEMGKDYIYSVSNCWRTRSWTGTMSTGRPRPARWATLRWRPRHGLRGCLCALVELRVAKHLRDLASRSQRHDGRREGIRVAVGRG